MRPPRISPALRRRLLGDEDVARVEVYGLGRASPRADSPRLSEQQHIPIRDLRRVICALRGTR